MTTYKYTDKKQSVVYVIDDDGVSRISGLTSVLVPEGANVEPADIPPDPTYQELRAAEYPPAADYLDGIVKNDKQQVAKYVADCLAVKAKYPKN